MPPGSSYIPRRAVDCVVKAYKRGSGSFSLQSLQFQWPPTLRRRLSKSGILSEYVLHMFDASLHQTGTSFRRGGTLLPEDDRFALMLGKYWGDLRKLINLKMQEKGIQGPPFEGRVPVRIMGQIARGMYTLHQSNVLHRDLKASNVLINLHSGNYCEYPDCYVSIVGTRFWRAPEILRALQTGTGHVVKFTRKADVYSFAMTCYEVLTGCIPLEDECASSYNVVLSGQGPALPDYIDCDLRKLLVRCWDSDPAKKLPFETILKELAQKIDHGRRNFKGKDWIPFFGWRARNTWYFDRHMDVSTVESEIYMKYGSYGGCGGSCGTDG